MSSDNDHDTWSDMKKTVSDASFLQRMITFTTLALVSVLVALWMSIYVYGV